jgi:hypothetical protein
VTTHQTRLNTMSTPTTSRHVDYFASRPVPRSRPSGIGATVGTPGSPRTPLLNRSVSGQFASPGALNREPEEIVIYELHPRFISAGFAGESRPRCVHRFGYQIGDGRRVGDYREFTDSRSAPPRDRNDDRWSSPFELFRADVRQLDVTLVSDRLERAVRQIHSDYLQLVSTRPLKAVLVVPSLMPTPILEVAMRVIFQHHAQPPAITLLTSPVLSCVSAGLRSALVVEVGWEETVVTGVGEHKAVAERRSIRGGKMLAREMAGLLGEAGGNEGVPFTFAEDVTRRMAWCKTPSSINSHSTVNIPKPDGSGTSVDMPFTKLAEPAETTFFSPSTDDHDYPLPALVYHTILALPVDLRALCMSRIVVTGPNSGIPGLKTRLLADLSRMIERRGWDVVESYGSASKPLPQRLLERTENVAPVAQLDGSGNVPISERLHDDLSDRLSREVVITISKGKEKVVKGVVRGVETLGAWSGASLVTSLRVKGKAEVEREPFLSGNGGGWKDEVLR